LRAVRRCAEKRFPGGKMRVWAWLVAVCLLGATAAGQAVNSQSLQEEKVNSVSSQGTWHEAGANERMFFPKDMLWGWAQFDLSPPHNEIDPNLCAGNSYAYGGVNAP